MFLGFRLKELRKEKNLSQMELGKILGVSKVSISGYEKGNRIPSMDIFMQILDTFDVSADYLLGRELTGVCEDDDLNLSIVLSTADVEIIRELRGKPSLYNIVAENPKRFFMPFNKKNI